MSEHKDVKENKLVQRTEAKKRVPLHEQNILSETISVPGFKIMWVNDYGNNVHRYELAGWDYVSQSDIGHQITHSGQVQFESQLSSVVSRKVNQSPEAKFTHAILMKIPLELYQEDQKAEQQKIYNQEKSWNSTLGKGTYGDGIEITHPK